MARVALVRDADLVEAEPHDQAAEIGIGFAQPQQMIDSGARQQLEVAGIDGQLDRRAELNQPIGQPRGRHLQRVLAVALRAHGVHDIGALPPAIDQSQESPRADPAGRRPCRRPRRRATSPCRRSPLRPRRSGATCSRSSRADCAGARRCSSDSDASVDASFTNSTSYSTFSPANILSSRATSVGMLSASLRKDNTTEMRGRSGLVMLKCSSTSCCGSSRSL